MPSDRRCSSSRSAVGGVTVRCKLVLVLVLFVILPNVCTESHGNGKSLQKYTFNHDVKIEKATDKKANRVQSIQSRSSYSRHS